MANDTSHTERPLGWRVGILSAAAGLTGALIGGLATYIAVNVQVAAEAEGRIREERRSAYVELVSAAHDVIRATDRFEPVGSELLPQEQDELVGIYTRVEFATFNVEIVGTGTAAAQAHVLLGALHAYQTAIVDGPSGNATPRSEALEALVEFIKTARRDLEA